MLENTHPAYQQNVLALMAKAKQTQHLARPLKLTENTKVGGRGHKTIHTASLPAGLSCPVNPVCGKGCYAIKGNFGTPSVMLSLLRNWALLRSDPDAYWRRWLVALDAATTDDIVRFNESGDFPSPAYIERLAALAQAKPQVTFYGYTRTWCNPAFVPALTILASLPNVSLNLSLDPTGPAAGPIPASLAHLSTWRIAVNDRTPSGIWTAKDTKLGRLPKAPRGTMTCPATVPDKARPIRCGIECRACITPTVVVHGAFLKH